MPPLRRPALESRFPHRPLNPAGTRETVWLFDLDNTLHDCSRGMFKAIDSAMRNAVATSLQLPPDQADVIRRNYWQRYGATVIGMVRHHGTDPAQFLELSHNFDVPSLVHTERHLRPSLARIRGRRVLLTNAPLSYAERVLNALGIRHLFSGVWAIDHMHLQGTMKPKPSLALMEQVKAQLGVPASRIVLVEDTLRNLKTARLAGMRTVHIYHPGTPFSAAHRGRNSYVNLRVNSIRELADRHAQFLNTPGTQGLC